MINYDKPFTYENSKNPWLMDSKSEKSLERVIKIDGHKITAKYLWTLTSNEREDILQKVFNYYRANGFPYEIYDDEYIKKQFNKLVKYNESCVINSDGTISNSGNLCLDICRHFCKDYFWKASSETMQSIESIFNNDERFINVLKNRMGWNTCMEDGTERPYMFEISDNMIRTGIRNSANGYGVSNFRPAIAKYFYKKYLTDINSPTILDYSGGWGARALAAASLGYNYIGIDPLTYNCINNIFDFLKTNHLYNGNGICYNSGSENTELFKNEIGEETVDLCFSCPPYFNLEVYSDDATQSYNEFDKFEDWIELYWRKTVKNCIYSLKKNGKFVLIIKDFYGKLPLKDEMNKIILEEGLEFVEEFQYKTTTNHLSGKKKTGRTSKNTEHILTYYKK